MRPRKAMRQYQNYFADLIINVMRLALWLDLGAGKTAVTLTAIADLLDDFAVKKVLVIAPKLVAETTWPDEIAEWEHLQHLTFTVCTGDEAERKAAIRTKTPIHLINRENVPWLVEQFGRNWPYDMVVIDDATTKSHETRTPTKKMTRFGAMWKVHRLIRYMVELTGTPAPNGLLGLWPQITLLDSGKRLGEKFTEFRRIYFEQDYSGHKWFPRENTEQLIHERLKDIAFSLPPEYYPEIPPVSYVNHWVDLNQKEQTQYDRFQKEYMAEIDGTLIEASTAGVQHGKLLQLANGAVYDAERNVNFFHDRKLDSLVDLVEEMNGQPVLIAYAYQHDLARIMKRLPTAKNLTDTADAIKLWNNGLIPILLAHPASCGHGLNLQYGGNVTIWFGLPDNLEHYIQLNKRLARPGQTRPVYIHHILTRKTKDVAAIPALTKKGATQDDLIKAVTYDLSLI